MAPGFALYRSHRILEETETRKDLQNRVQRRPVSARLAYYTHREPETGEETGNSDNKDRPIDIVGRSPGAPVTDPFSGN